MGKYYYRWDLPDELVERLERERSKRERTEGGRFAQVNTKKAFDDDLELDLAEFKRLLAAGDYAGCERIAKRLREHSRIPVRLPRSQRPRCGAMTRKGSPCQAPVVWLKGEPLPRERCRMHGGLSTGPVTPEGKAAIAESNRRRAKGI